MVSLPLAHHPDHPPSAPAFKLWVNVDHAASFGANATTNLFFCVGAPIGRFLVSPPADEPARADELWKTTCFEAFVQPVGSTGYEEWNFAPSGDWAAYGFSSRRENMANAEVIASPYIRLEDNFTWWALGATIAVPAGQAYRLALSAVLEQQDGTKSYWALAHPPGEPDFHYPDCFAATLP